MAKMYVTVVVGLLAIAGAAAIDLSDELELPEKRATEFDENTVGLDLHHDHFYYSDNKVIGDTFKRAKYLSIKTTLAGQQPDLTKTTQKAATNPFAVAQTASTPVGSLMDRWDYKQTDHGYQLFGLYHGVGSAFVLNKLRAQLLRRVANAVQDFLPFLDQAYESPEFKGNTLYMDDVKHSVGQIIKAVYNEIDTSIRGSMLDNDDSQAAATVVIITKHYVIVANSGEGRVLGYDSTSQLRDLTNEAAIISAPVIDGQRKEFGANKSKSKGLAEPDLGFYERTFDDEDGDPANIQFVTVQTGPTAGAVSSEQTKKIVISQVDAHKYRKENEQDLHRGVVTNLLRAASSQTGVKRWLMNIDFSTIFIALETDYKTIH